MNEFWGLFWGTLISEDISCITGGILAKQGKISLLNSILACTFGIYFGDILLFLSGKFFSGILKKWSRFNYIFESGYYSKTIKSLENNFIKIIFLSRFMPGTRLPVYLISGTGNNFFYKFIFYSFLACSVWTPILVTISFYYGRILESFFRQSYSFYYITFSIISFFLIYNFLMTILIKKRRENFFLKIEKYSKLEFWPVTIFYIPLVFYATYLVIRYFGFRYVTASNPGIPMGGFAGESKTDILNNLPEESILKFFSINKEEDNKFEKILDWMKVKNISFPIILKPDAGERGAGVTLIKEVKKLEEELLKVNYDLIAQEFHPGPGEAGIFYFRFPNEKNGKIFSITDKEFPVIFGDGKTDLKNLIKSHKRFKFQKDTYYQYLGDKVNSIPKEGVKIPLGFAGNHFQGCLFKDGKDLISEELEKEIDRISKHFKGFYFGRYDIRYETKEDLLKGINFKIVELNGAASESTNLYDPNFNIFQSYKILFSQWKILFKIGYLNYKKGENITSWKEFFGTIFKHFEYKDEVNLFTKES